MLGTEGRLGQVLRNLISNAVSFSPPGGEIVLAAQRQGRSVTVTVDDQGPGIPPDKLTAIFERFDSERPKGEKFGTHSGLGLSISKQIVEAHGGTLTAENLRDEDGHAVTTATLFDGDKPLVLVFDYFRCTTLCGVVLGDLAAALAQVPLTPGKDYAVMAVSIDPDDSPADAAALERITLWALTQYSPVVAMDLPDGIVMDTEGADHLQGGEQIMLTATANRFRAKSLTARVAIADTWGAAHACARASAQCRPPQGHRKSRRFRRYRRRHRLQFLLRLFPQLPRPLPGKSERDAAAAEAQGLIIEWDQGFGAACAESDSASSSADSSGRIISSIASPSWRESAFFGQTSDSDCA